MIQAKFKYQINHYLSIQPGNVSIDSLSRLLAARFEIPASTFNHDRFIPPEDSFEIPLSRLNVYAFVLGASVGQLTKRHELTVI